MFKVNINELSDLYYPHEVDLKYKCVLSKYQIVKGFYYHYVMKYCKYRD